MTVSVHDVAAALRQRLPGLTVKKLHKLLYYCQGHHLASFGEPLFGETVSAWDMGPVVGELWYAEKHGELPVPRADLNEKQLNTIGYVVSRYGALSGSDLRHLTHAETPWRRADEHRPPGGRARVKPSAMAHYFRFEGADPDDPEAILLDPATVSELLRDAPSRRELPATTDTPEALRARLRG